ncbi:hypothetical protein CYMTET_12763, partial [Cymbomonas tetramitiformis]
VCLQSFVPTDVDLDAVPANCIYFDGLYIEGASWNSDKSQLEDAKPRQPYGRMSIICIHSTVSPGDEYKNIFEHAAHPKRFDQEYEKQHGNNYMCPIYRTPHRCRTEEQDGGVSQHQILLKVPLNCGSNSVSHWIKHGVALMSGPSD